MLKGNQSVENTNTDRDGKTDSSSQTTRDTGTKDTVLEKVMWQLINISLFSLLAPM